MPPKAKLPERIAVPTILKKATREDAVVVVQSFSKAYCMTGWRVGWVLAPPDLTDSVRKVHDFLTVGAAAPLQQAGVLALGLPESYYGQLSQAYSARRDHLVASLQAAGFKCFIPRGAYYVMTDIKSFGFADDSSFVHHLITHLGVAAVPGSSFFSDVSVGTQFVRFCFCKKYETLEMARHQLFKLKSN